MRSLTPVTLGITPPVDETTGLTAFDVVIGPETLSGLVVSLCSVKPDCLVVEVIVPVGGGVVAAEGVVNGPLSNISLVKHIGLQS